MSLYSLMSYISIMSYVSIIMAVYGVIYVNFDWKYIMYSSDFFGLELSLIKYIKFAFNC